MVTANMIDRSRRRARRAVVGVARRLGVRRFGQQMSRYLAGEPRPVAHRPYLAATPLSPSLEVAEWMAFRGHLFADAVVPPDVGGSPVVAVAVRFESESWERRVRPGEGRVAWVTPIPVQQSSWQVALGLRCANGRRYVVADPSSLVTAKHGFAGPLEKFVAWLNELDRGVIVEIGARARSGVTHHEFVPPHLRYVGVDIVEGPNVDIVGDAHELSALIEPGTIDGVFSIATFEHLAMPWRCAVEINRVLKPGGFCFVSSHQTFPLHETPWDFFRFSDAAWRAIFNDATGFEVLDISMGEAAAVAGLAITPITWKMDSAVAYLGSAVTCRKTHEATVDWPVPLAAIERSAYPGRTEAPAPRQRRSDSP